MANSGSSGAHTHPPTLSIPVLQSQEASDRLQPLVDDLNRILDRLEHLAGLEEGEQPPDASTTDP
jgi:hypothetical protein